MDHDPNVYYGVKILSFFGSLPFNFFMIKFPIQKQVLDNNQHLTLKNQNYVQTQQSVLIQIFSIFVFL